jgi:hypothetical protein
MGADRVQPPQLAVGDDHPRRLALLQQAHHRRPGVFFGPLRIAQVVAPVQKPVPRVGQEQRRGILLRGLRVEPVVWLGAALASRLPPTLREAHGPQHGNQQLGPDHLVGLPRQPAPGALVQLTQPEVGRARILVPGGGSRRVLEAPAEVVIGEEGVVVEVRLRPLGHRVRRQQLVGLREKVGLRPGETSQHAQLHRAGLAPVHRQGVRAHGAARYGEQARGVGLGGDVALQKDEVDAFVISGEHQEVIARALAERPSQGARGRHGETGELEEVYLEKPVLLGQQLDPPDAPRHRLGGDSQVGCGLLRPNVGVVAQTREERRQCVCGMKVLDVVRLERNVERTGIARAGIWCSHGTAERWGCYGAGAAPGAEGV